MISGRYAPSPTGALHLGNLRTALAACLHARSFGGRFLLRIEDLDRPRVKAGAEARQLDDLHALGIEWDEVPLRQSERSEVYRRALDRLLESRHAYPCFCSRKDLAASAPHRDDGIPPYPGTCRELPSKDAAERIALGKQHCHRLRIDGAPAVFRDRFLGDVPMDLAGSGGDFVVRRADGLFAYQLACAVDDSLSGVTDVVRGADLLDSGFRQEWLLRLLGMPVPRYAHIPLMMGENGERLSKRAGAADLESFLNAGFDATAIRSYLAWTLGQCDRGERPSMQELVGRFDLHRVPREDAVFRIDDLSCFVPSHS